MENEVKSLFIFVQHTLAQFWVVKGRKQDTDMLKWLFEY